MGFIFSTSGEASAFLIRHMSFQTKAHRCQNNNQGTTIRFPPGACTPCLYITGGTQGCNQDFICSLSSQWLSAEFSKKKIPLSQTQVCGFKYKSTKDGAWIGKSLSCSHQSFIRKTLYSLVWQESVFLSSLLPWFLCSEMLRAALLVLS